MGSSEMDKSSKEAKEAKEPKTPIPQEQPPATTAGAVNPEWSGFQAYSPMPPHGFLASNPQAHPYMWGVQHLMPPYGTPPHPYVSMYPHGGIYAHPSLPPGSYPFSPFAMPSPNGIAEHSVNNTGNLEVDGKPSEGKEKLPIKRSKGSMGSLNMITGKDNDPGKTSGASANGAYSKSADSGSEGSSDGSDANSQNEAQMQSGCRQGSAEASGNGSEAYISRNGGLNAPHSIMNQNMAVVPIPATKPPGGAPGPTANLNIGMDYWGASAPAIPAIHVPSVPVARGMVAAGPRDGFQSQIWDERELKRQRRKQSNRESARRSRLRKQAECDELAQHAESLKEENASLKAEVNRLRSEYEQLLAQNTTLKERLYEVTGKENLRSSGIDHLGKDTQHSGQAETVQSVQ